MLDESVLLSLNLEVASVGVCCTGICGLENVLARLMEKDFCVVILPILLTRTLLDEPRTPDLWCVKFSGLILAVSYKIFFLTIFILFLTDFRFLLHCINLQNNRMNKTYGLIRSRIVDSMPALGYNVSNLY